MYNAHMYLLRQPDHRQPVIEAARAPGTSYSIHSITRSIPRMRRNIAKRIHSIPRMRRNILKMPTFCTADAQEHDKNAYILYRGCAGTQ